MKRYDAKDTILRSLRQLLSGFIAFLFFFLPSAVESYDSAKPKDSLHLELSPSKINPGDAFVIRIRGMNTSNQPEASFNGSTLVFSRCGETCFVAVGAADLETKPGVYTVDMKIGATEFTRFLVVKPASFRTIRLSLPEEKVSLSPEDLRRVEREERMLKALWETTSEKLMAGSFTSPLRHELSTPFGTKRIINNKTVSVHKGMDIRGKTGDEIKASNRGIVVLAEELFYGGNTVILDHGLGIYTVYMHLSAFKVKTGDVVFRGEVIGLVGSTGRSSGPHLHFGAKVQGMSVNPSSLLKLSL